MTPSAVNTGEISSKLCLKLCHIYNNVIGLIRTEHKEDVSLQGEQSWSKTHENVTLEDGPLLNVMVGAWQERGHEGDRRGAGGADCRMSSS